MVKNKPIDMEVQAGAAPAVSGREIDNPDNDRTDNRVIPIATEAKAPIDPKQFSEDMQNKLKFIPVEFHERVSKLTREELVGVGIPQDREAYNVYLYAEKMQRDANRRKTKEDDLGAKKPKTYDA
jgi:hypothetical protein